MSSGASKARGYMKAIHAKAKRKQRERDEQKEMIEKQNEILLGKIEKLMKKLLKPSAFKKL